MLTRDADDRHVEVAGLDHALQRREDLLERQVASDPKKTSASPCPRSRRMLAPCQPPIVATGREGRRRVRAIEFATTPEALRAPCGGHDAQRRSPLVDSDDDNHQ